MWVCFNDAFVSIVTDPKNPGWLLVRARRKEHLQALFPAQRVITTPKNDYRYRVSLPMLVVMETVSKRIQDLKYPNFKDSVKEDELHNMYAKWWGDHYKFQR